uniref:Uncharacterized protein n=2 Tax=viral metagenome TaxID=1070528 RepID=A0A6H1ZKG9_9ZZZZ
MGDSHYKSNIVAKVGTETISGFNKVTVATVTATNLYSNKIIGVTSASAPSMYASSKVRIGTGGYLQMAARQYMFFGAAPNQAGIIAEATNLVGTAVRGSLYLQRTNTIGSSCNIWFFTSNTVASPVGLIQRTDNP